MSASLRNTLQSSCPGKYMEKLRVVVRGQMAGDNMALLENVSSELWHYQSSRPDEWKAEWKVEVANRRPGLKKRDSDFPQITLEAPLEHFSSTKGESASSTGPELKVMNLYNAGDIPDELLHQTAGALGGIQPRNIGIKYTVLNNGFVNDIGLLSFHMIHEDKNHFFVTARGWAVPTELALGETRVWNEWLWLCELGAGSFRKPWNRGPRIRHSAEAGDLGEWITKTMHRFTWLSAGLGTYMAIDIRKCRVT
ncbi:hypothetical protein EV424DRAFT_1351412 [Suillus variegatus]|nr:hypothetical protein EV424DRAFT_1351412 [Suillus variegatus]